MKKSLLTSILLATAIAAYITYSMSQEVGTVEITIFADRTLQAPLEEIAESYKEHMTNLGIDVKITFVYGSSGYVLSQLKIHGKGDLYIADDSHFALIGVREGILREDTYREIGYIHLSLIVPEGNPKAIRSVRDALSRDDVRIAVGNPEHVSAGILAYQLFKEHNMTGRVEELVRSGRVVYVNSASEAASQVILGTIDAALTFNIYEILYPDKLDAVKDPIVEGVKAPVVIAVPRNHGAYSLDLYSYILDNVEVFEKYGVQVEK